MVQPWGVATSLSLSALVLLGGCKAPTQAAEPAGRPQPHAAAAAPSADPLPAMPTTAQTAYRAGLYVADGKLVDRRSDRGAISGGQIGDALAAGLTISTRGRDDFNAVLVRGTGVYTVHDARLDLHGDGSNDFLGLGAGVMAEGGATVVIRNSRIDTHGLISSATAALAHGTLKVYDSTLRAHGGTLPPGYVPKIGPGMKQAPPPLKIRGTARTTLTAGDSHSYFYRSTVIADGWGALSTDAPGASYLEANDTTVQVLDSGYGAYADHDCTVVINRGRFDVATYAGVVAGQGSLTFNGLQSVSRGNTVMIHSVMGKGPEIGTLKISGGHYRSDQDAILVKSANADIALDAADLHAGNGVLVHSVVNDDPHATRVDGRRVSGVRITLHGMRADGDIVHEDTGRRMRLQLQHAQLRGAVRHAELVMDADSRWEASGNSQVLLVGSVRPEQLSAAAGIVIEAIAGAGNGLAGRYRLRGGGVLQVRSAR